MLTRLLRTLAFSSTLLALPALAQTAASLPLTPDLEQPVRVQLSARDAATLSAQMDGRIVSFGGREGSSFKKGATLATFDCRVQRAELARAVAQRDAARNNARVVQRLVKLNSASELEAAKVASELAAANASVAVGAAVVSRCQIKAPFDGSIAAEEARAHEYVTAGQPLLKIHDPGTLEAEAIVPSRWLRWLQTGTPFRVHVEERSRDYQATVVRIGAEVDAVSQSVKVFARLTGDISDLLPGMSGFAQFPKP